jgi:hypothetical protein
MRSLSDAMANSTRTREPGVRRFRPGRSMALVLAGVMVTSALWVVVAAVASADPPPVDCTNDTSDQCRKLSPVLTCVWLNGDGTFAAVFGYSNGSSHDAISIPIGSNNGFSPAPVNRGQPTLFPAETTVANALVITTSGPLTWSLSGHSVTATSGSTKCAQNPVPMIGNWRAFAVALAFCAPIGYVAYRRLRPRWPGFRWQLSPAAQPRSK